MVFLGLCVVSSVLPLALCTVRLYVYVFMYTHGLETRSTYVCRMPRAARLLLGRVLGPSAAVSETFHMSSDVTLPV